MRAPTDSRSVKRKLIDNLMAAKGKRPLRAYVKAERAKGTPWRVIAADVRLLTGEDISAPTLIAWFPELTHTEGQA